MKKKLLFPGFFIALLILTAIACSGKKENTPLPSNRDMTEIKKSGEITVLTLSGSISYFLFKGVEMGYEYELIRNFAESQNLKLNIRIAENVNRLTEMLQSGEGDIVAYNIPLTYEFKEEFIYCGENQIDEQVLVQRNTKGDTLLTDVTELIGKEIWALKNTKYYNRLENLNGELGGGIIIKEIEKDTVTVEDLISMVSSGEIAYTLSDHNLAQLNKTYFRNLNINLKVSHPQRSSWVVSKTSPELAKTVDEWFKTNSKTTRYKSIQKRYFEMSKLPGDGPAPLLSAGVISEYDDIFREYAKSIDWDWQLLASIAFQESRFKLNLEAWTGAVGLMGLMPKTAEAHGITAAERTLPEPSVKAAVSLIKGLERSFVKVEDKNEKIKFILASYNAGLGQIRDGQALAEKYGKNPYLWEGNVEECLKWKRLPEYYNDSVCKFGYFRGTETLSYVQNVMERWQYYKSKVPN